MAETKNGHSKASKAITDRNADEAQYLMVKRVGETEFRPIRELADEDRELAEAIRGGSSAKGSPDQEKDS